MRSGGHTEADLEALLNAGGGVMTRTLGRATRVVGKPWHMYPPGFLFGLGFDTATEVSLLFLAAGAAGSGIPWYASLCLPVQFAAGMSLLDTIDGSFVNFAHSWTFSNPVRKVFYNITITGLSVAAALIIGTVELLSIAAEKLSLHGAFWKWAGGIDLNSVGYAAVLLFVITWAAALLIWRYGRIDEKWTLAPQAVGTTDRVGHRTRECTAAPKPAVADACPRPCFREGEAGRINAGRALRRPSAVASDVHVVEVRSVSGSGFGDAPRIHDRVVAGEGRV